MTAAIGIGLTAAIVGVLGSAGASSAVPEADGHVVTRVGGSPLPGGLPGGLSLDEIVPRPSRALCIGCW